MSATQGAPTENPAERPREDAARNPAGVEQRAAEQQAATNAAVNRATGGATAETHHQAPAASENHHAGETHGAGHEDEHGSGSHGKDTIQGLIDATRNFKTSAHVPKITAREKVNAAVTAATAGTVAFAPAVANTIGSNSITGTSMAWLGNTISTVGAGIQNVVQNIPFVGPGIVETASALQNAAVGTVSSLGPMGSVSAAGAGLGALWLAGKAKSIFTHKEYAGFWRPVYEAVKTPVELGYMAVNLPYQAAIHGPGYVADKVYNGTKTAWKHTITPAYNWAEKTLWKPYVKPALVPSAWGVGAGLAGAGILAPFTGGSSLLVGAAAYGLTNLANHYGWLKAKAGADAHAGGHH